MMNHVRLVFVATVVSVLAFNSPAAQKQEPKKEKSKKGFPHEIKWETKDFEVAVESAFHMKIKSWTLEDAKAPGTGTEFRALKLLLERTTDTDPPQKQGAMTLFMRKIISADDYKGHVEVGCFDAENVRIATLMSTIGGFTEGQYPAKKGEAFRGFIAFPLNFSVAKIRKMEFSLVLPKTKAK